MKNKLLKLVTLVMIIVLAVASFTACGEKLSVTFNLNYEGSTPTVIEVAKGKTVKLPTAPTRDGYTFAGWYTTAEGDTAFDEKTAISAEVTVYAKWTANAPTTYTVTFDLNYVGSTAIPIVVNSGDKAEIPTAPTRDGYTFAGWYTTAEGDTAFDNQAVITANATVYAKWNENTPTHTVTFKFNYEGSTDILVDTEEGKTVEIPTAPTREGFTFGGWYTDQETTKSFKPTTKITTGITLYAKWFEEFTVTFNFNYSGPANKQAETIKSKVGAPTAPTREEYDFRGWYTDSNCTVPFDFTTTLTADVTLYAYWTQGCMITYNLNYEGATNVVIFVDEDTVLEVPTVPTRTDYKFRGWFADQKCTRPFDFTQAITGDTVIYAFWNQGFMVIFNLNYEGATCTVAYTNKAGRINPPSQPKREGYDFEGWFTDPEDPTTIFDFTPLLTQDAVFYARWARTVNITYKWNYDKADTVTTTKIGKILYPNAGVRNNYTFAGWFTDPACTTPYVSAPVTEAITLYAKWLDIFSVTFKPNCDGEDLSDVVRKVTDGEKVVPAKTILRKQYDLVGWYKDAACSEGQEVDLNAPITGEVTYYAKWELKEFEVAFVLKYTTDLDTTPRQTFVNVVSGGKVTEPATTPVRDGYTFEGWFADADGTTPFDFANTVITANTRIWAKWTDLTPATAAEQKEAFETWLDELFVNEFTGGSTISLHYSFKDPSKYGLGAQEVNIGSVNIDEDVIKEGEHGLVDLYCEFFDFNPDLLTDAQNLEYRSLKLYLETLMLSEGLDFISGYCDSISGVQNNMPINLAEYNFYSEQDVIDYLELLTQLPRYFDEILAFEQKRVDLGFGYVDSKINEAISQCRDFLRDKETNFLIITFNDRIDELNEVLPEEDKMSPEEITTYKATNVTNFNNYVVPAYKTLRDGLKSFLGKAEIEGGLAQYFGGTDYYEFLLKYYTGTERSLTGSRNIIDWLEKYVNATKADALESGPSYLESSNPADLGFEFQSSGTDLTVQPKSILTWIINNVMEGNFPKLDDEVYTNYTISFVHEALEDALSPAFYMIPAIDNYKSNSIYINRGSVDQSDILGNYTTLGHEGFPGHLYQTAYYYDNIGRVVAEEGAEKRWHEARIIVSCTGYVEGWTSYIEKVLYEEHDFPAETSDRDIERLKNSDIFFMVFISRIDIGVNYEGWTLADVQSYHDKVMAGSGLSYNVQSLYDFVVGAPANYLKYTLGMLEFLELRDYAKTELGDKFTLMGFHTALLDVGECQMVFVREAVQDYIDTVKAAD